MIELSHFGYTSCAHVSRCSFDELALDRGGLLVNRATGHARESRQLGELLIICTWSSLSLID